MTTQVQCRERDKGGRDASVSDNNINDDEITKLNKSKERNNQQRETADADSTINEHCITQNKQHHTKGKREKSSSNNVNESINQHTQDDIKQTTINETSDHQHTDNTSNSWWQTRTSATTINKA